jgi:nitrogen fixation protein FixH
MDERRSLWIPWALCGIFAVFLIANGVMLYFATRSWTGLATDNAYEKGLAYNAAIAAAETQAALGWQVEVTAGLGAETAAWVEVAVTDREGRPVVAEQVRARFVRPTHVGYDRDAALTAYDAGRYRGEVELPLAGQWDLRVRIEHAGGVYRADRRVVLGSDG